MMMLWLSCLLIGSITCRTLEKAYGSEAPAAAPAVPNLRPHLPAFLWDLGRVGSSSPGSSSSLPRPSSGKPSQPSAPHDVPSSASSGSFRDERYKPAVSGYGAPYAASQSSGYGDSATGGSYGSSASGYGGSYGGGYGSSASGYGGGYGSSASGYGGGYGSSDSGYGGGYGSSDSGYGGSYGGGYGSSASGYVGDGYVAPQDESSNSGSSINDGAGDENPEPVFSDVSDLEPVYSFSSRSSYQRGQAVFAQTRYTPGEPVPPFPLSTHSSEATLQPNAPANAPAKGGF